MAAFLSDFLALLLHINALVACIGVRDEPGSQYFLIDFSLEVNRVGLSGIEFKRLLLAPVFIAFSLNIGASARF